MYKNKKQQCVTVSDNGRTTRKQARSKAGRKSRSKDLEGDVKDLETSSGGQ